MDPKFNGRNDLEINIDEQNLCDHDYLYNPAHLTEYTEYVVL